jgi:hypothetical protein
MRVLQWTEGPESNPSRRETSLASVVPGMVMDEDAVVSTVAELAQQYRTKNPATDELVLVLPRWMWDQFGQERLTASFKRVGVQHVKVVDDWRQEHTSRPQLLLYAAGTWHTNHHIGQTNPDCEGCQHAS